MHDVGELLLLISRQSSANCCKASASHFGAATWVVSIWIASVSLGTSRFRMKSAALIVTERCLASCSRSAGLERSAHTISDGAPCLSPAAQQSNVEKQQALCTRQSNHEHCQSHNLKGRPTQLQMAPHTSVLLY